MHNLLGRAPRGPEPGSDTSEGGRQSEDHPLHLNFCQCVLFDLERPLRPDLLKSGVLFFLGPPVEPGRILILGRSFILLPFKRQQWSQVMCAGGNDC